MRQIHCSRMEEWLVASLNDDLDPRDKDRFEAHLQHCDRCRAVQEEVIRLISAVRQDVPEDPGDEFWRYHESSLQAALQEADLHRGWVPPWKAIGAILAAGLVILAIAVGTLTQRKHQIADRGRPSLEVIEELNRVYGPGWEDVPSLTDNQGEKLTVAGSQLAVDEGYLFWFEVEEDPYQLSLWGQSSSPERESSAEQLLKSVIVERHAPTNRRAGSRVAGTYRLPIPWLETPQRTMKIAQSPPVLVGPVPETA